MEISLLIMEKSWNNHGISIWNFCGNPDGYSEEFGVAVGVHQGSVLSPLLFIIVLEALSESMEELLVKLKTWKTEMEKKGLRVNMGKTKIMVSGMDLDLLKKSGKDPCGVCQ